LISNCLSNEELNGIILYLLKSNKIENITEYEIDCMSLMNNLYKNKINPVITNTKRCKYINENIDENKIEKVEDVSNEKIIKQICDKLEPKSLFNRDFNEGKSYYLIYNINLLYFFILHSRFNKH